MKKIFIILLCSIAWLAHGQSRQITSFNNNWKFLLGDDSLAFQPNYNDEGWRRLNLPHDWSIEGMFRKDAPCKTDGGALPTGIGWYRKTFSHQLQSGKKVYIDFDGVYRNSQVWINGHYLGIRPYGYSSFRYELTPYLANGENVIAVKVDNAAQPNSRYYSGSGINRNVWLVTTSDVHIAHWGVFVTTPEVSKQEAKFAIQVQIEKPRSISTSSIISILTTVYNNQNKVVATAKTNNLDLKDTLNTFQQEFKIAQPALWSVSSPNMYKVINQVVENGQIVDTYETPFGIRSFRFDAEKGFFLNGEPMKIYGVCNHHDAGALGAAVNTRAIERQLEILKAMGCNAIRTAHNPFAPEFYDLCDRIGFVVMDEAFDIWHKKKNKQDYHNEFDQWHKADLEAMVLRDRNHPSVMMWSIGNEIREQFDSTGITIAKELTDIVKLLDNTRPVTSALTENDPAKNYIWKSGSLDILGFNYKEDAYADLPKRFPGKAFVATETMSALATRGHYDMPSDSIRLWPKDGKTPFVENGNSDWTVSAYDHVMAYWGSPHERTWNIIKKLDHMAGMFIWSGFDFIGEPVPYPWPARSAYYGVVDLCGFPKDAYYLYQSEWTSKPVLHVFPHWNWESGQTVDVWAYYSKADEVELFLNGKSLGAKRKQSDTLHVMWRVKYVPGTLKAISRKNGKTVLAQEIKTAGAPAKIELMVDRKTIKADSLDLAYVTVKVVDKDGNLVPNANNFISFDLQGTGFIAGVDNGYEASLEPFKAPYRKAYNGMCLAIIQSNGKAGKIELKASSDGLQSVAMVIKTVK
jgi:beta-galactosidase